jgi:hypothetical protein
MRRVLLEFALIVIALCGCSVGRGDPDRTPADQSAEEVVEGDGVIRWRTVEGGVFVIEAQDGTVFEPLALPREYQSDGLQVHFKVRRRSDLLSSRMVGDLVEIIEIKRRDGVSRPADAEPSSG